MKVSSFFRAVLGVVMGSTMLGCSTFFKAEEEAFHGVQYGDILLAEVVKKVQLPYLMYLPSKYNEQEKWPLIMSLHGSSLRGNSLARLKTEGMPKLLDLHPGFRFIVLSPLLPAGKLWSNDELIVLLDHIVEEYNVDEDQVYLTGYDLGGFATWDLASAYPDRFAAIAPISAGGNEDAVCRLKYVPVWIIHGEDDVIVSAAEARRMADALKACGGRGKLTVYPDTDHDAWSEVYTDVELYLWFLENRRVQRHEKYTLIPGPQRLSPKTGFLPRVTGRNLRRVL